jgi:trehalose-phosphatase
MPRPIQEPWWVSIQAELKSPLALFLDFDGTLVPIAPRPEDSRLSSATRHLLNSLSCEVPVVLVSGRALRDLREKVSLRQVTYVGNHGLEIVGRGFRYQMQNAGHWRQFLKVLAGRLQKGLRGLPGVFLENKGYTLSIHYRLANFSSRRKAQHWVRQLVNPVEGKGLVHIGLGKAVWEIRPPVAWDKGHAVNWILKQSGFRERWPLYIGDDDTDQDAFRAIQSHGIGIWVGPAQKKRSAHYTLASPSQVYEFLKWLSDQICREKEKSA